MFWDAEAIKLRFLHSLWR